MSDTELVHAIARGDAQALALFYDRYNSIILGCLLRILHDRVEAEDVLQEVFIQVWQRAANFDESRGRPFTWLVTIARSRAIDRQRALTARYRAEGTFIKLREEVSDRVEDAAINSEHYEMVRSAMAELPEDSKRALLLGYIEGLTHSEIAALMKQPLGTVKTRIRSGLRKLHEILQKKSEKRR